VLFLTSSRKLRCFTLFLTIGAFFLGSNFPALAASLWQEKEEEAETAFSKGHYQEAHNHWLEAQTLAAGQPLDLAQTLNQMTHLLLKQNRLDEAKVNLETSLKIRMKELGANDSKTLETMGNLALIEHKLGNNKDAEKLYKEVIEAKRSTKQEQTLATTLANLAGLYTEQWCFVEAQTLYLEALALDEKNLGKENVTVAEDLFNLGVLNYNHHYYDKASDYFNQALSNYSNLKNEHGQIKSHHYLGLCLAKQHKHAEAVNSYKQALNLHQKEKGQEHIDTLVHQLNIADSLERLGQADEAEKIYKYALNCAASCHQEARIRYIECLLEYCHYLRRQNRKEEAKLQLSKAFPIYESLSNSEKRHLYELPLVYRDLLLDLKQKSKADEMAKKHLAVFGKSKSKKR
jgi:tetratricopeptide (TPR) repeat protein